MSAAPLLRPVLVSMVAVAALTSGVTASTVAPVHAYTAGSNPTVLENQRAGSSGWQLPQSGRKVADDVTRQVKGYADATSVNKGGEIGFHVSVNPAQKFRAQIWRLGYYGGTGGRLVTTSDWVKAAPGDRCLAPADGYAEYGLVECHWAESLRVPIPQTWVSGMYLALLTNEAGFNNYVPFTVRDDARKAEILVVEPHTTWQAYNQFPYDGKVGKSLYGGYGPKVRRADGAEAVKVSFDRPYMQNGAGHAFFDVYQATFWLEKSGYDLTYVDSLDLHTGRARPADHRLLLSPGHDEYWSKEMYDRVETAHAGGLNLGFLSTNNIYWSIRLEKSSTGVAHRTVVCFKSATRDPVKGTLASVLWRDKGRAEQRLLGSMYNSMVAGTTDWVVRDATAPSYAGSGLVKGSKLPSTIWFEADGIFAKYPKPDARQTWELSSSPYKLRSDPSKTYIQNGVLHQARNGAWVFNAGTGGWSPNLANTATEHNKLRAITTRLLALLTGRTAAAGADPSLPVAPALPAVAARTTPVAPGLTPLLTLPAVDAETARTAGVGTDRLVAAAPACRSHRCQLLSRVDGFGPHASVAALLGWDGGSTGANYQAVVVDRDGRFLWASPEQSAGQVNGYERLVRDGRDRLHLTLVRPGHGSQLATLEWRGGELVGGATFLRPRLYADGAVFVEDRDRDGRAELVAQSSDGVPHAEAGALVESVFQSTPTGPKLTGCRLREPESFKWSEYQPTERGCGV